MRRAKAQTILSAKAATGFGTTFDCDEYDEVILTLIGYDTASLTAKVQGCDQLDEPDFTAAADETNVWAYKYAFDENSGSSIQGSTGVTFAADGIYELKINTGNMKYLNVEVSAYTSGKLTAIARGVRRNY